MHLFILTETNFNYPSEIIYQKVLDIIEVGAHSTHLHFYIVGHQIPLSHQDLYTKYSHVTILTKPSAEIMIEQVTNALVLHFGAALKGSEHFPHYFIPLTDPALMDLPSWWSKWKQRQLFKQYLKKAVAIFCINDWSLGSLRKNYPTFANKFQSACLPVYLLPKLEWVDLSETREQLTKGNNYFLIFLPLGHLVETLKEFSIFKKWQQTTMSLMIIVDSTTALEEAHQIVKGYKYKEDLVFKTLAEIKIEWLAASYAILLDAIDYDKTSIIEWAIHYEIPLLFNQLQSQPDAWLQAGEIFLFSEKTTLSNHFKMYYKDEMYRQARAKMGKVWLLEMTEQWNLNHFVKIPIDLKS
jgi:hypothetical protein